MSNVYIIGNGNTAKTPPQKNDGDIIVMFNVPIIKHVHPDIVFIANTFHPSRRFVKAKCYNNWDKKHVRFIFPYTDEIIKSSPLHQTKISFKKKIRGWRNNSYKKCINGFRYEFLSKDTYNNALTHLNLDSNTHVPSTGFLAIYHFLSQNYPVFISGFTFDGYEGHNWKREKEFINENIHKRKIQQF